MANICWNEFYACSEDPKNMEHISKFINENFNGDVWESGEDTVEASFESRWEFPENLMKEMFEDMPNKDDIYMRCLSVEYGCLYHALWVCEDKEGWEEV